MSIQEIAVTNNQKKLLLKAIKNDTVLIQDDNGDLVVNVEAYENFKATLKSKALPLEEIIGEGVLDFDSEFFVFS